ncbi:glycosyltransferase family 2 protein [Patescibacteria group bacterium]|nr:glycosyltransferase family 2 protein [Patescibacteria group bacterium]MCL5091437.1 glycosyltransferase family 2 protein [Patescibacteria group bacterium]
MISVVIPTYKNRQVFLTNLRQNLRWLEHEEIVVVNDDPDADLTNAMQPYPNLRLLQNPVNLGFGPSVNRGVKLATQPVLFLLNDDVMLTGTGFLDAVKYFRRDRHLFAVGFAQQEKDGRLVGKNRLFWQRGLFHHRAATDLEFGDTAWAEGGCCLVDKRKFVQLHGFDPIYAPFYWEDIDLCYRAKLKQWKVLFDPQYVTVHHHESTIGTHYRRRDIETVAFRNQLIFTWKNIRTATGWIEHLVYLPYNLLYYPIKGSWPFVIGLIQAIVKILFANEK